MKNQTIALAFFFFFLFPEVNGQTDTTVVDAEPVGGVEMLALKVYGVRFTPEQRILLEDVRLELIFYVSDTGAARLEIVNGTYNPAIRDSLFSLNGQWPPFRPQMVGGIPKQTIYGMYISLPGDSEQILSLQLSRKKLKMADFEYYTCDSTGYDLLIGGLVNHYTGLAGHYLATGGGFLVSMHLYNRKQLSLGFSMQFYGNELKKPYPIDDMRRQNSHPPTLLLGLGAGKRWRNSQALVEIQYAAHNVVPATPPDENFVQFRGISAGMAYHRYIKFGKDHLTAPYGAISVASHYINLHAAFRYQIYNINASSGLMLEAGLSYRLRVLRMTDYKLKL